MPRLQKSVTDVARIIASRTSRTITALTPSTTIKYVIARQLHAPRV
jgi:hypothetical protein